MSSGKPAPRDRAAERRTRDAGHDPTPNQPAVEHAAIAAPAGGWRSRIRPLRARVAPTLAAVGAIGGLLSGLLGVGGGVIMVPLLVVWAGFSQRSAHAMSLGAIIPISLAGVLTFGAAGEIDFKAAALLAVSSIVGARTGAGVLANADDRKLKLVFGLFLLAAAVLMITDAG